jgi:hypothetical protein
MKSKMRLLSNHWATPPGSSPGDSRRAGRWPIREKMSRPVTLGNHGLFEEEASRQRVFFSCLDGFSTARDCGALQGKPRRPALSFRLAKQTNLTPNQDCTEARHRCSTGILSALRRSAATECHPYVSVTTQISNERVQNNGLRFSSKWLANIDSSGSPLLTRASPDRVQSDRFKRLY